jgi:hypothetical protein
MDAIERKNGLVLGSKKIKVSIARQSCEDIKHCKLYVTNIPRMFLEREVHELFSRVSHYIIR